MIVRCTVLLLVCGLVACDTKKKDTLSEYAKAAPTALYSVPASRSIYSPAVGDTFRIFTSVPRSYHHDTTTTYPLVLILDANAYFEPVVAEAKLNTLTQDLPPCVLVGIGYADFWKMDSLRDRDDTWPKASPEDSFKLSGGADKFKRFIDDELLPRLATQFRIDQKKITLMGHSLGGYFAIYHFLTSLEKKISRINHYVAVSPSLFYANHYLLDLQARLGVLKNPFPFRLYVSMGSLEREVGEKENLFKDFGDQFKQFKYPGNRIKLVEFGNFDHMDSAMPGFMKGLEFVLEK